MSLRLLSSIAHAAFAPGLTRGAGVAALLLMVLGSQAQAAVKIDKIDDFRFGTWVPSAGTLIDRRVVCVQSDNGVAVADWTASVVDLDGNSTATQFRIGEKKGSSTLNVEIRVTDLLGVTSESLDPGVGVGPMTGAEKKCPAGDNLEIEVRIDAAALSAAAAARFEGDLRLAAVGSGDDDDAKFRIRVDIPDLVQISDMDDIPLGHYPGAGDLVGSDDVCVYRNDPSANYEIQAAGQGAGSAFLLEDGAFSMPFEVDYDDGSGFTPLLAGGGAVSATGADTSNISCGGSRNGTLRVTVREADALVAEAGAYLGTLTLTVAPI